jgi:hypothetical protein
MKNYYHGGWITAAAIVFAFFAFLSLVSGQTNGVVIIEISTSDSTKPTYIWTNLNSPPEVLNWEEGMMSLPTYSHQIVGYDMRPKSAMFVAGESTTFIAYRTNSVNFTNNSAPLEKSNGDDTMPPMPPMPPK